MSSIYCFFFVTNKAPVLCQETWFEMFLSSLEFNTIPLGLLLAHVRHE